MKLKDAREAYQDYSSRASEATRMLALAGIGIIWVLRVEGPSQAITSQLLLPLLLFAACLGSHLLHYVSAALVWGIYHRYKETKTSGGETVEFLAPQWLNWFGNSFFFCKVCLVIAGYAVLGKYALNLFR